jgi:toxin ParE1/3/4
MRWFPASPPFINYLIFYRPAKQGIEVVRVLHGARDVEEMVDDPAG